GIERELRQALAEQGHFFQHFVRDRDDVAADAIGLYQVEDLARAGPDQLQLRLGFHDGERLLHYRQGIDAGIGDAAGKHRNVGAGAALEGVDSGVNLVERQDGGDVEADIFAGEPPDEGRRALAPGVSDGNLHVYVGAESGKLARLA